MKTHIKPEFELMDIPRGVVFIFGCAVVVLIVTGTMIRRTWKWWTL